MNTKTSGSVVIIPSTTDAFYWALYNEARKATRSCKALLTVNIDKVESLIKKGKLNKVIIIMGAKKVSGGPFPVYSRLKKLDPKIKFVLMAGWMYPVRKKDKMISLPVRDLANHIKQLLKD